jgi:hypothetical protein
MVMYNCMCCTFGSTIKTHYNRHLKTNKHKKNNKAYEAAKMENILKTSTSVKKTSKNIQKHPVNPNEKSKFYCDHCDESFTLYTNKRRHELHRCKSNLNNIITEKNNTITKIEKIHENEKKQLYKQIELLLDKVGNTTTNITNNTQNIQLNNYGNEDLSHISDTLKGQLISMPYGMIPKLIEAVHFNDSMPGNKNIALTNKNDNKVKIFNGTKWIYKNKEETLNDLVDGKYFILDTYFEYNSNMLNKTNKSNYKKFRNYFDEKDKKLIEKLKNECELILLNNR